MFIRLVSTHKLKIKFLKVFLTRSFLFIQEIELTHWRWHSWVIVEDNYCDKMRHLPSDHSLSVKIFPSESCRQNVAHNTLIVLHKYLHHLFPGPAGNSWDRTLNCQIVIERRQLPPSWGWQWQRWHWHCHSHLGLYCWYWPWQGWATNTEDTMIFHSC